MVSSLLSVYYIGEIVMERDKHIKLFEKYLSRQINHEELTELVCWLKNAPDSDDWLNSLWNEAGGNLDEGVKSAIFEKIEHRIASSSQQKLLNLNTSSKRKWLSVVSRWAAVLLLPLISGMSVYLLVKPHNIVNGSLVIAVDKGQKASATLPDGSKVWINSSSRLTYDGSYNIENRVVDLCGEAYFEVKPDKKRPFIVKTTNFSVKALGTAFNVKAYNDDKELSAVLVSGKVEVVAGNSKALLMPNEKVLYDRGCNTLAKMPVDNVKAYTCWRSNEMAFEAESFESIVATLERNYNVKMVFASESLKKYRFTGTVGNTNLQSMLQILSLSSPLEYSMEQGVVILKENKQKKAFYENALK